MDVVSLDPTNIFFGFLGFAVVVVFLSRGPRSGRLSLRENTLFLS